MANDNSRPHPDRHSADTPYDAEGNPDWKALARPEGAASAHPFTRAMNGQATTPPPETDPATAATDQPVDDAAPTGSGQSGGDAVADSQHDSGEPDEASAGRPVFYTQRGLETIEGAMRQTFPDMNGERGPDGLPRVMVEQLIVPLHESIRVLQPDGEEQTLDPAQTPFAVRDVRGRVHALSADEHAALTEQGRKLDEDQGARGGANNVSFLAGGLSAVVNALRGGQEKIERAKASRALEQANAAAAERRQYEPWWTSRAQADVSVANEHIAKAADIGKKIRGHPDVRESVNALHAAQKRTLHDPNDIEAWMDYRKASRDISRNIANNPELSEDLQAMRGHLDQTEMAVKSALEAADEAKGQDYAMRDALQGLDTTGLEQATEYLRTHTNDGRSDSGEDTEEQVERMRELMKAVQASFSNLVNRIMRLGKGQDNGPEPAA